MVDPKRMRDAERLREKTEFALEGRQIAGLLAGALVLLGAVFAVGLLVGKHLAAQPQPALAMAELAPVERKPAAEDPPAPKQPPAIAVAAAAAVPAAPAPPPRDEGDFTIQVGASKDRAEAQRLVQKAHAAGLKAYVVEADLGQKGTWYRVRVGAFKDKDSASNFRHDVERELRVAAVVMSTH